MPFIDPAEEIQRLLDEEEMTHDEAVAIVKANLKRRQALAIKPRKVSKKPPAQYTWTPQSQHRGTENSRGKGGRPKAKQGVTRY